MDNEKRAALIGILKHAKSTPDPTSIILDSVALSELIETTLDLDSKYESLVEELSAFHHDLFATRNVTFADKLDRIIHNNPTTFK